MTLLIQFFVKFPLNLVAFLWWDYGCNAVLAGIFQNFSCSGGELGSDRFTMRIHGKVKFRVEPPFVRPISWFLHFEPVP